MAQTVRSYKSASSEANGLVYSLPRTSLMVNIVCERESVRRGPYARFAQKYFGTMAPLADKDVYTIVDATIEAFEEADPSAVYVLENAEKSPVKLYSATAEGAVIAGVDGQGKAPSRFESIPSTDKLFQDMGLNPIFEQREILTYDGADTSFMRVPVSTMETVERTIEEQAEEAVEALFTLRRRRFDLVTGEMGEHVFGAGMEAALKEMERLENEYLALFFGKTFKQTIVKTYNVVPDAAQKTMIVCRFSASTGLMASNDLSGSPIVLEMTPEGKTTSSVMPTSSRDDRGKVFMRVADVVNCRIADSNKTIAEQRVPIFQFGSTIEAPSTSLR